MNSRVILCRNAFGLGNVHFMKTGSDFVPVFTLGKRGNPNNFISWQSVGQGYLV